MVRAAFNPHFTLEHVLADGDKVAVMWTNRGTHVGEWFGIPPTGKTIATPGVDIFLLRDGRLAEHWDVVDVTDFLVKTGALPAPSGAPGAAR
jgi:predicted ester cyclase